MGKTARKLGFGLVLGALAGHYFTTEKGQKTLAKLKDEVAVFKANPSGYKDDVVNRVKAVVTENLQVAYDNKDDIMALFSPEETAKETSEQPTGAEVDDIVITYDEEDL